MFTERDALRQRLQEIKEERIRLNDEHWNIIFRLRELDKTDREQFSMVDANGIFQGLVEHTNRLAQLIPAVDQNKVFNVAVEELKHELKQSQTEIEIEESTETTKISRKEIIRQKDIEERTVTKRTRTSILDVAQNIITILKENGPMKVKDLEQQMKERFNYNVQGFPHSIRRAQEFDDRIQKVKHGWYEYK